VTIVLVVAAGILCIVAVRYSVARTVGTILSLYAASVPIGSLIAVRVPLPPPFNTLSSLLGALVIAAGLGHILLHGRGRVPTLPVGMWLLFLTWSGLTTFWALEAGVAVRALSVAVPLLVLLVVVGMMPVAASDLDILRTAIISSGMIVGIYASVLVLSGSQLPTHGISERFAVATGSEQSDPNILAASLLLPLALSVEQMIVGGTRWWGPAIWRSIGVLGAIFSLAAIISTASRGGMLAGSAVLVLCFYFCTRLPNGSRLVKRTLMRIGVALSAIASFVIISIIVWPHGPMAQGLERLPESEPVQRIIGAQIGSSGRIEIWTAGQMLCREHCAWGAGLGNFPIAYNDVFPFTGSLRNVGADRPAHNLYIGLAVEIGVGGILLWGLALATEWWTLSAGELRTQAPALKAGLAGLLVATIFLSAIWFKYFWLVFVMIRVAEGIGEPEESLPNVRRSPVFPPTIARVEH
jgi:O-Antigen ligase